MRVGIASGKGGTGKTMIATSLAWLLARQGRAVRYVDADVEEPNGQLLLHPAISGRRRFAVAVPALSRPTCSGCGECQQSCAFNAILALPDRVLVLPELCHSCGGCELACPDRVLIEEAQEIGTIETGTVSGLPDLAFHSATLDVAQPRATPLIAALLREVPDGELVLLDAPPGTSCSVMEVMSRADLVLLVTEPTPFGRHDLALAVELGRALRKPLVGVINRSDLGDGRVRDYFAAEDIPLLAEIPFTREVAVAYAAGEIPAQASAELRERLAPVAARIAAGVQLSG